MSRPSAPGPPSPSLVHERKLLHRFEPAVTCVACQPSCSTQSGTVSTEAERTCVLGTLAVQCSNARSFRSGKCKTLREFETDTSAGRASKDGFLSDEFETPTTACGKSCVAQLL